MRTCERVKEDAGISLLQTALVLAIVAVLVVLAVPVWRELVVRAQAGTCQQNQRKIAEAISLARTDGKAGRSEGYYDALLERGLPWGRVLIPEYLPEPLTCPVSRALYNLSPLGDVRSDQGAGQYFFVNQGQQNDHRWSGQ